LAAIADLVSSLQGYAVSFDELRHQVLLNPHPRPGWSNPQSARF
jgi:hypothetical protein